MVTIGSSLTSDGAEKAIIGELLFAPHRAREAAGVVSPADFANPRLANIFSLIAALVSSGGELTQLTVFEEVKRRRTRDGQAQWPSPSDLVDLVGTGTGGVQEAAKLIRAAALRREVVTLARGSAFAAETADDPAAVIIEAAEKFTRLRDDRLAGDTGLRGQIWADVAAFLADGIPEPPRPSTLRRDDGAALFYAGKVNVLFGDPESGKSWIAYAAAVQALGDGRKAAIIDVDHNGLPEVITRLMLLGAHPDALSDPERFRYTEPEDGATLRQAVADLQQWHASVAVVDSIGEILPMLGLSSNSPDEYTRGNREVLTAIAGAGTCVVAIDHLPKSDEARQRGATGTVAKKRAINGSSIRVTVRDQFAPGRGGSASLVIDKDRPGGLRATCPIDGKYQPAGLFVMEPLPGGGVSWHITAPRIGDARVGNGDVAELDALDPPPRSQRDVKARMGWSSNRAMAALKAWRESKGADPDVDA